MKKKRNSNLTNQERPLWPPLGHAMRAGEQPTRRPQNRTSCASLRLSHSTKMVVKGTQTLRNQRTKEMSQRVSFSNRLQLETERRPRGLIKRLQNQRRPRQRAVRPSGSAAPVSRTQRTPMQSASLNHHDLRSSTIGLSWRRTKQEQLLLTRRHVPNKAWTTIRKQCGTGSTFTTWTLTYKR